MEQCRRKCAIRPRKEARAAGAWVGHDMSRRGHGPTRVRRPAGNIGTTARDPHGHRTGQSGNDPNGGSRARARSTPTTEAGAPSGASAHVAKVPITYIMSITIADFSWCSIGRVKLLLPVPRRLNCREGATRPAADAATPGTGPHHARIAALPSYRSPRAPTIHTSGCRSGCRHTAAAVKRFGATKAAHCDVLETYVAAPLRQRGERLGAMSMLERLPGWLKSRPEVLRPIRRMQLSLHQPT